MEEQLSSHNRGMECEMSEFAEMTKRTKGKNKTLKHWETYMDFLLKEEKK